MKFMDLVFHRYANPFLLLNGMIQTGSLSGFIDVFMKQQTEETKIDYYNRKYIYCEGELAFLNDSVQRPAEYHDMTVRGYLAKLIELHNEQVEEDKRFEVGIVTVTDPNDSLYRYTNWENTLTTIKEDLISSLGGYIRVRNANGHRYLDLIKDYGNINTQVIEFGENLLDFTRHLDLTDIATVVVPLGARLEESSIQALEERLTIESVNGGKDYLVNTEAVKQYGWVVKVVTWDDVTTSERLKVKGQNWLNDEQFDAVTIEAKAVDLHYVDDSQETFKLGDSVRIVSAVHGLDRYFPVTKLVISLNNLGSNTVTFNGTAKVSVSARSNAVSQSLRTTIEQIPTKNAVVQEAINQATALITAATHGYVTITEDASELLIADNADYKKATKLWRWNLNGLGYSNTGYNGTYATAITMDGQILGDRLVGNSVDASKLTVSYKSAVTKEIADAADSARDDAEDYTDTKLKSYYTKSEVETSISNTKDAILLSAKETAVQYVDGKLKNYSTSAQIKVTTDAITAEVNKKVDSTEVQSLIEQNADSIRLKTGKLSWSATNSSLTEDGTFTCKNAVIEGDISTSKVINNWKFNSNIGTVKAWYQGEALERGGFSVRTKYSSYEGIISISPAPYCYRTSYGSRGANIISSNRCLQIEAHIDNPYTSVSSNLWSGVRFEYATVSFIVGDGTTVLTPLTLGRMSDNSMPSVTCNGRWHIPPYMTGTIYDTTTSSANVYVGNSNSAKVCRVSSSSKRYKHTITDVDEELNPEALYNLPVHSFTYNDGYLSESDRNYGKRMIGFIAEEVDEIYPKACQYDDLNRPEMWNAQILLPAMLKLIQNQHEEIQLLKRKVG